MKKIYLISFLFYCLIFLNSILYSQNKLPIILNKALDKRVFIYDEEKLFKQVGYFTKESIIGGRLLNSKLKNVIISDVPIALLVTQQIYDALTFCNYNVVESSSNNRGLSLDIEINNFFLGYVPGGNNNNYIPEYEIILTLKNAENKTLLKKNINYGAIYYSWYKDNFTDYFSTKLFNYLICFFQSDVFIEAYNGRQKIFKDFIKPCVQDTSLLGKPTIKSTIPLDVDSVRITNHILENQDNIYNFKNLYELNLSGFSFRRSHSNLNKLSLNNLRYLSLINCGHLKNIDNIKASENLIYLDLSTNYHIQKYRSINSLKNLKILNLNENNLKNIDIISNLKKLLVLELQNNSINKILNLNNNTKLISIDLSGNKIRKIEILDKLKDLKKLDLSGNPIKKIENLNKNNNLEYLSLGFTNIKKIENLDNLVNLKQLYLNNTKINKIENIDNLINLKVLSLNGTSIKNIEGINNLINLKELYLGGTKISELDNIENLKKLTVLNISHTKIKSLKIIENFPELTILDITGAKINKIESIEKCSKLNKIKAKEIQIEYISKASYDFLKKRDWKFYENLTLDEWIDEYKIEIID